MLRQHWINRWGSLIPGGVVAAAGISLCHPGMSDGALIVAALSVLVPAYLVVRAFRGGIRLNDETIVIRGLFWSRTVPRHRATGVSRLRFLLWTSRSGRQRRSPLAMFWEYPRMTEGMSALNESVVADVQRWIRDDAPRKPSHAIDD